MPGDRRGTRAVWSSVGAFVLFAAVFAVSSWGGWTLTGADFADKDLASGWYYPARALLDGRNPYDVVDFMARYPVRQEFPLYGPHHLLLVLPVALLGPLSAAKVAVALSGALTVVLARVLLADAGRSAAPAATVLVTAAAIAASRYAALAYELVNTTVLVVVGVALAASPKRPAWLQAVGIGLALTKPQFGVPLVLCLLAFGRVAVALRGVLLTVLLALGPTVAVLVAAGGPGALVESLQGNATYSFEAPYTRAGDGDSVRVDLADALGRLTGTTPPSTLQVVLALAACAAAVVVLRRARPLDGSPLGQVALTVTYVATCFVGFVHPFYDPLVLVVPIAALAAAWPSLGPVVRRALVVPGAVLLLYGYLVRYPLLRVLGRSDDPTEHSVDLLIVGTELGLVLGLGAALLVLAQVWRAAGAGGPRS